MISAVAKRIPTQAGDVLILQTSQSFTIYALGVVTTDGQQDFGVPASPTHVTDRGAAIRDGEDISHPRPPDILTPHRQRRLV